MSNEDSGAIKTVIRIEWTHPAERISPSTDQVIAYGPTAHIIETLHRIGFDDANTKVVVILNDEPMKLVSIGSARGRRAITVTLARLAIVDALAALDVPRSMVDRSQPTIVCAEGHHRQCGGRVLVSDIGKSEHYYPCPCDCHGIVERLAGLAPRHKGRIKKDKQARTRG